MLSVHVQSSVSWQKAQVVGTHVLYFSVEHSVREVRISRHYYLNWDVASCSTISHAKVINNKDPSLYLVQKASVSLNYHPQEPYQN